MSVAMMQSRVAATSRLQVPRMPMRKGLAVPTRIVKAHDSDGMKFEVTYKGNWVPAIASALFIAAKQNVYTFTSEELRMVLAVAALALPVVNTLIRKENYDWVSSGLAPAALGAEVLNILTAVPAAVVAFGSALCNDLSKFINIKGAFYFLLATLAAAVYYARATVWFTVAFAVLTGTQCVDAFRDNRVLVIPCVFTACLAYAVFDFIQTKSLAQMTDITMCIVAAQVAWSIFRTARQFANETADEMED